LNVRDTNLTSGDTTMIFVADPNSFNENATYVFKLVLHNKEHPEMGADMISSESLKK
jgi:hypothetical protein